MLSDIPTVVVRNQSTIPDRDAWNLAWSLGYQVRWQFGPIWKISADVSLLPKGIEVPKDAWIIDLLETSDEPGALGYHDEEGKQVPFARVFNKTAQADGVPVTEVASHELLEMLVDPHVNQSAFDPHSGRLYAMEVGDPAQGGAYDLGAPYGKLTGIVMSDFALPSWFDPTTPAETPTSFRGVCKGPFALGKKGYVSYTTALPPSWQQEMGELADRTRVDHDDRLARR